MSHSSGRRRARCLQFMVAGLFLTGLSGDVRAQPAYVPPWHENYQRDEFLMRRLSFVLDGLIATTHDDPDLQATLHKLSLRTPVQSDDETLPNAYASPSTERNFIFFESRFAAQIGGVSAAGAYMALFESRSALDRVCQQLEADDEDAKRRGATPLFATELEKFPQSKDPTTLRALQRLEGLIADEAMIWFLLHEAGHHALKQQPTLVLEDSRKLEAAADQWASQAMLRLGYGLFGAEKYLTGRATLEVCLEDLGYELKEEDSTHPTWKTRALTMIDGFDTTLAGRGSPRSFLIPGPIDDLWFHIAEADDDTYSMISDPLTGPRRVAAEWNGAQLTIYARIQNGERFVWRIDNARRAMLNVKRTHYDSTNEPVAEPDTFLALQMNPPFMDWLEVAPGIRVADFRGKSSLGVLRDELRAVGLPESSIALVLEASETFATAEKQIYTGAQKGELNQQAATVRYAQALDQYLRVRSVHVQPEQETELKRRIDSHPLAKWSAGQGADYFEKLEQQMFDRNFRKGK